MIKLLGSSRAVSFALATTACGAVLAISTPARAGDVCEVNGTSATLGAAVGGGAIACGFNASASGDGGSAYGLSATASGSGSSAYGNNAIATGTNASAYGDNVSASGSASSAFGNNSTASGLNGVAIGTGASDGGFSNSVALGSSSTVTADHQVNVGGRTVSGVGNGQISATSTDAVNGSQLFAVQSQVDTNTTAIIGLQTDVGTLQTDVAANSAAIADLQAATASLQYVDVNSSAAPASATGSEAIAVGGASLASGAGSVAIGHGAAGGTEGVAIGDGASNATFANSVAIGAGTVNTADNQVAVGGQTADTARTVTGVAAGDVSATSFDAVNGSQLYATNQAVGALQGSVNQLFDLRKQDRRDMRRGVAVALSMADAPMPSKPGGVSYQMKAGTFRGEHAISGALTYRLNTHSPVAVSAGIAYGGNKNTGASVALSGEF